MFSVYLILCQNGAFYCGYTNNPSRRFEEHKTKKGARYTAWNKVVEMRIIKKFQNRGAAMRYEKEIKKKSKIQKRELFSSGFRLGS